MASTRRSHRGGARWPAWAITSATSPSTSASLSGAGSGPPARSAGGRGRGPRPHPSSPPGEGGEAFVRLPVIGLDGGDRLARLAPERLGIEAPRPGEVVEEMPEPPPLPGGAPMQPSACRRRDASTAKGPDLRLPAPAGRRAPAADRAVPSAPVPRRGARAAARASAGRGRARFGSAPRRRGARGRAGRGDRSDPRSPRAGRSPGRSAPPRGPASAGHRRRPAARPAASPPGPPPWRSRTGRTQRRGAGAAGIGPLHGKILAGDDHRVGVGLGQDRGEAGETVMAHVGRGVQDGRRELRGAQPDLAEARPQPRQHLLERGRAGSRQAEGDDRAAHRANSCVGIIPTRPGHDITPPEPSSLASGISGNLPTQSPPGRRACAPALSRAGRGGGRPRRRACCGACPARRRSCRGRDPAIRGSRCR